ncbi:CHU large protein; mannosidase-related protein [unidentified eubacterium SCB49]|nr:CHU large protein; mannosidase-related protein [unidentified eubacterium SCB49]
MNKKILFGFIVALIGMQVFAQAPANDLCADAIAIGCGDIVIGDTSTATETGEVVDFCGTGDGAPGVWYSFAGTGDNITVSLCDSSYDTKLQVFTGNCNGPVCIDGSDDACGTQSEVTFTSDSNSNYLIYVFGFGTSVGEFTLEITCAAPPPDTVNDLCEDALPISCGETLTGFTDNSTTTGAPTGTCGTTSGAPGNWYSFTGTGDIVTASLCSGTNYDTKIQIYSGNCNSLMCVDGNDDFCGLQSEVTFVSDPFTNYFIYVYGFGSNVGTYGLELTCVTPSPPPPNDECDLSAAAALVNLDDQCTLLNPGTIAGATSSNVVNDCVGTANDDVWYSFVATTEIHTIELLNIAGGTTDLVHAVYEGPDCDNLTQLFCNDPNDSFATDLVVGNTYFIRVWSWGTSALELTTFDLCIASFIPPTPPVNDECDGAIVAGVNTDDTCTVVTAGTVTGATDSGVTSSCPGNSNDDVWFEFVATSNVHNINLQDIVGDGFPDLVHALYSGADCDNLTELYCSDANNSTSSDFIIGDTYYIRVFSFGNVPFQEIDFNLCINQGLETIIVNGVNDPQTNLTAEELVEQVFVEQGGCGTVDITFTNLQENPAGVTDINQRSWGYFKKGNSSFDIEDGIILSSGYADSAEGGNDQSGTSDTGTGWAGDVDLQAILDNQYGTTVPTQNATVFEFEFTSNIPLVTFDFIFASEEYEDDFECSDSFRDGFAFLVKGPGIPDTSGAPFGGVNIASIEGSDNVPVSTATIHRDTFLCGGEVEGVNYFPDLYVSNWADNLNAQPVEFDGLTSVLTTATVPLEIGETYTVKLVIGDRSDSAFDSAVFLAGGSFDLGSLDLGGDITIGGGDALCEGEEITLVAGEFEDVTIVWTKDGTVIPDETSGTLIVTETGTYEVTVTFNNTTCEIGDSIFVEFFEKPLVDLGSDLLVCDGNTITIDGTPSNEADLTNITYQWSLDGVDLAGETNATIMVSDEGVYAVVVGASGDCIGTDEVFVNALDFNVNLGDDMSFCGEESFTIVPVIEGEDATNASYLWNTGETSPTLVVTTTGTYSLEVTIEGCTSTDEVSITLLDQPVVTISATRMDATGEAVVKCANDTETLTAIVTEADANAVTYTWFLDGGEIANETSATIDITEEGLYQVEVNGAGCIATDDISVAFFDNANCIITQGISPDGDGLNDSLDLEFLNVQPGIDKLSIFNRHGLLVFEQANYVNEWHGQADNGNELPVGTYYYVINLVEGEALTGFIYLNK